MPDNASLDPKQLVQRALTETPEDKVKVRNYLLALKDVLDRQEADRVRSEQLLKEHEEAYEKLTAPANRLGLFLKHLDTGHALVALGDTEFVSEIDPKLGAEGLEAGLRVRLNDAYAVVGVLEPSEGGQLAKVSEVLSDGRLRLGSGPPGGESRFVTRSEALKGETISAGDEVRLDPSGRLALERFHEGETQDYFFEDVPEIPWEKVGGQREAIDLIRDTIEQPLLHPEIYAKYEKKPVKGILLYGPPGCGKTLIGKATAYNLTKEYSKRVGHEVKEYFMYISGPKILNMWLGETERMVRDIFRTAREKAKEGRLVFIFVDEAESVLRTRSSGRWLNISNTVVPQFCAELDGMVALENVVLMLTSNRPDYIDPAVLRPERIDRKVKIGRPDKAAAAQIMGIYLHASIPMAPELLKKHDGEVDCARKELVEAAIENLWRQSRETEFLKVSLRSGLGETLYWKDLVSGALIKSVVERAKDLAIRRAIADPQIETGIGLSDLLAAIEAEYRENEIFPKSDTQEDWLKLLDYDPENVATVKPVRHGREDLAGRGVI